MVISARPIAVACCSPPERLPALAWRRGLRFGNASSTRSTLQSPALPDVLPSSRFSSTRHLREQPPAFRHQRDAHADAPVRGHRRDVGIAEQDAAAGRQMRAGDRPQQRRLAGAVGADQRQRLAALDAEADVAHRLQQAVP